jgi:cytosine/adenosine deaminase-related metal-dependent hydrolase
VTGPLLPTGGARVLGLDGHGLDPGCWADLTLIPAATVGEAVVAHPPRSLVLKRGRVVAGP